MTEVEVDEMFGFCMAQSVRRSQVQQAIINLTVCDEAPKIATDYAMPGCTLLRVELGTSVSEQ